MARTTVHVCSQCGFQSAQWRGQCPGCEAWNTLVEERLRAAGAERRGEGARLRVLGPGNGSGASGRLTPRPLREVGTAPIKRLSTGIGELDRVLGGGLVPGSLVLLGGSPGLAKSPPTNIAPCHLPPAVPPPLYASPEAPPAHVRLRP